jgi:hypothetical protein
MCGLKHFIWLISVVMKRLGVCFIRPEISLEDNKFINITIWSWDIFFYAWDYKKYQFQIIKFNL